ncbi:MAG: DEAD/DEAH box helicase [Methanobacteriota archaeon]
MKFEEIDINPLILEAVRDLKFKEMTFIQESVLPSALDGKDVIGQSPTGSGKTVAFSIPLIQKVEKGKGVQTLVLSPTRELALQITDMIKDMSRYKKVNVVTVYGGQPIKVQFVGLRKAEIVVGTPGRVLDHLRRGTLDLSGVRILVLDEADRMLDMGFIRDITAIIGHIPRNRQTLLFGATIPGEIRELAERFMKNPEIFRSGNGIEEPKVEQTYIEVRKNEKFQMLLALLKREDPFSAIIFTNTQIMADVLSKNLYKNRINAWAIHGGLTQSRRERIMGRFRKGDFPILVATDVASRGLDITGVSHIFNYDIPSSADDYTHRIGRTARAGKTGRAICILTPDGYDNMRRIHADHKDVKPEVFGGFDSGDYPRIRFSMERSGFRKNVRRFGNGRGNLKISSPPPRY